MIEVASSSRDAGAPPRVLTAEVRAELGLSAVERAPYPWAFAGVVVGTACIPLVLASLWTLTVMAAGIGFVLLPVMRWFEYREASWRDAVYRTGVEVTGRVLDVEPPGSRRRDHIVRVEFVADGAVVCASVIGCPLARKGLAPGEDVVVLYEANRPARCIVVARSRSEVAPHPVPTSNPGPSSS